MMLIGWSVPCNGDRSGSLAEHVRFLERLGIAGVSHHSLLFSKATNVVLVPDEDAERFDPSLLMILSYFSPLFLYLFLFLHRLKI